MAKGQSGKYARNTILHPVKLFLQIELGDWRDSTFEKPLLTYASSLSSDLIGAELDNQSETAVADLVIRLTDQVQSLFVFVQAKADQPLGATLRLFHHLIKNEKKVHRIILSGSHDPVTKMLAPLGNRFSIDSDPVLIQSEIKRFALAEAG